MPEWTKERIASLAPGEIKNLRKNASERGVLEVVALCDEVFGSKLNAAVAREKASRQPRIQRAANMTKQRAFELRGVKLRNLRWSWGGVREADGTIVVTMWIEEIRQTPNGFEYLLWGPNVDGKRPWADKPGGRERLEHCMIGLSQGVGEGVLIFGERRGRELPPDEPSRVAGIDPLKVIRFAVEKRGDEYWATWTDKPVDPSNL